MKTCWNVALSPRVLNVDANAVTWSASHSGRFFLHARVPGKNNKPLNSKWRIWYWVCHIASVDTVAKNREGNFLILPPGKWTLVVQPISQSHYWISYHIDLFLSYFITNQLSECYVLNLIRENYVLYECHWYISLCWKLRLKLRSWFGNCYT